MIEKIDTLVDIFQATCISLDYKRRVWTGEEPNLGYPPKSKEKQLSDMSRSLAAIRKTIREIRAKLLH